MPKPKIEDARALSDEALSDEILAVKKELFELRLQKATRQLEGPHQLKWAKHRLAQLMMVEGDRTRGAVSEVAAATSTKTATSEPKAQAKSETKAETVAVEAVAADDTDADESEVS